MPPDPNPSFWYTALLHSTVGKALSTILSKKSVKKSVLQYMKTCFAKEFLKS
jgi:hypothetical protein